MGESPESKVRANGRCRDMSPCSPAGQPISSHMGISEASGKHGISWKNLMITAISIILRYRCNRYAHGTHSQRARALQVKVFGAVESCSNNDGRNDASETVLDLSRTRHRVSIISKERRDWLSQEPPQ